MGEYMNFGGNLKRAATAIGLQTSSGNNALQNQSQYLP